MNIQKIKKKKDNDPSNFFLYYSNFTNNSSFVKNPLDVKIHLYCLDLRQKIKDNQNLSQIHLNLDENFFEMVHHSLNKLYRNQDDILLIEYYLMSFPNLMKSIYQKKMMYDPTDLLSRISLYIKYEEIKKNTVICKLGEIGDKFYIIFDGSVAILIPREIKVNLNYNEYFSHLKRLYNLEEFEIVKRIINSNIHIFMTREIIEMREKLNTDLTLYYASNVQEIISIREYINRLEPIIFDNSTDETSPIKKKYSDEFNLKIKHSVTCWSYYYVTNITQGQTFGDIALSDEIKTRTATIISLETSYLGSLNIDIYKSCIKDVQEKIRKNNIQFLLSIDLFNNFKFETFDNKYFNFFKNITLKRGEYLFQKNMERIDIFFIKEGEIEINFEANFNDINYIIKRKENLDEKEKKKQEKEEENPFIKKLSKFFLDNKIIIKLFIYSERQMCGLNDFLLDENKFFCNGKCVSEKSEIFAIDYKVLNDMFLDEKQKFELKLLIEKKEKLIVDKLKTIKCFYFQKIKENNNSKKSLYHPVNFIKIINKKFNLNKNNLIKRNYSFDNCSKNFDKKYNINHLNKNKTLIHLQKKINLFNNAKKILINKEIQQRKSIFSIYLNLNGIKKNKFHEKNKNNFHIKKHNSENKIKNKVSEIIDNSIEKNKLLKNNSFYKKKKNISIINLFALDDVIEQKYPNLYIKRNKSESNIKKQFTIMKKNNKKLLKIIPCPFPKVNNKINNNIKITKTNNTKIIEY